MQQQIETPSTTGVLTIPLLKVNSKNENSVRNIYVKAKENATQQDKGENVILNTATVLEISKDATIFVRFNVLKNVI